MSDRSSAAAPATRSALPLLAFWGVVALCLAMTLAYPAYQLGKTGGLLYYVNGPDETSYLQYAFSRAVESLSRPGQYLVSLGHAWGLSGGWINVAADALALLAFPWLCRLLLRRVGWSSAQASLGALLVLVLPMAFQESNPIINGLSEWNVRSGLIYWLNMPDMATSPLTRSPEPQFSLVLLAAAMWVALRLRTFWPIYPVLGVMYPFVSIPAAFVLLACHLRAHWPARARRLATAGPLALAFVAVGAACWAYYHVLVGEAARLVVIPSHLPLISLTGLLALGLFAALRRGMAPEYRFFALAVALAPWVASNQQLISGHIPQPSNFEQYLGCVAAAVVAALGVQARPRLGAGLVALGVGLFVAASYQNFRINQSYMIRLPMTPELASALREDSPNTVVNDVGLSAMLGLAYARQAPTALATDKIFTMVSEGYAAEYSCLKRQIAADYPGAFDASFRWLDDAYDDGGQGYLMAHINRKRDFVKVRDVRTLACTDPRPRPLRYFFINWFPTPKKQPAPAVTPAP
jgi:hypothetical protein